MQHTKLDRWLVRKFVHINRIYFNTMPDSLPEDLEIEEAPEESGATYKYRATTRDEEMAKEVCDMFAQQNITYTARIDKMDTPFARFIGNPHRSVTILFMTIGLALMGILFAFSGIPQAYISNLLTEKEVLDEAIKKK